MDYINPFSAIDPSQFASGATVSQAAAAGGKGFAANDFIEMSKQKQALSLQEALMKMQEMQSLDAVEGRKLKIQTENATNRATLEKMPHETAAAVAKFKSELELQPFLTEEKKETAIAKIREVKGKPYESLYKGAADMYSALSALPEDQRPMAYAQVLQRWSQSNPGLEVPPFMANYHEKTMAGLGTMAFGYLNSIEERQKARLQKQQDDARYNQAVDTANIQGEWGVRRERIQQAGANSRDAAKDARADAKEVKQTPAQALARARRTLAISKDPQEIAAAKIEIESNSAEIIGKLIKADPELFAAAAMTTLTGPMGDNARRTYKEGTTRKKFEFYLSQGIAHKAIVGGREVIIFGDDAMDVATGKTGKVKQ